ncbi:MAG: OmpA family protein [Verrucomicrobia bacterium]|nr:OmpA family protein [Verrucomicrobiota bacterium]
MPKSTWIFASILSALVLLSIGWLQIQSNNRARAQAEARAAEAASRQAADASTNAALAAELLVALARVAELEEAVALAEKAQVGLEQQMRGELESRDVTISELRGRLTVDILDRILFPSGEARLKPEGEALLGKVASILAKYPDRAVQIVGHTDNVPIRSRTAEGFTDNWALSAGRAVSAVRYLTERAGVDPRRLSAVGAGEYRPIAPNDTAEGRARNRRIAIVVLPEEFAAPDVKPPTPVPTPAPDPAAPAAPEPETTPQP